MSSSAWIPFRNCQFTFSYWQTFVRYSTILQLISSNNRSYYFLDSRIIHAIPLVFLLIVMAIEHLTHRHSPITIINCSEYYAQTYCYLYLYSVQGKQIKEERIVSYLGDSFWRFKDIMLKELFRPLIIVYFMKYLDDFYLSTITLQV